MLNDTLKAACARLELEPAHICMTSTKTGYELSSNVYTCEQLTNLIRAASNTPGRAYINRNSCSVVRARV